MPEFALLLRERLVTKALHRPLLLLALFVGGNAFAATTLDDARFLREPMRRTDEFRVTGVRADAGTVTLALRRFEVFARQVDLRADDGHGHVQRLPRPRTRYYLGHVEGSRDAVFLAVEENGRARGVVERVDGRVAIEADGERGLRLVPIAPPADRTDGGFRCTSEDVEQARVLVERVQASAPAPTTPRGQRPYRVRIAIETDFQFFQKLNSNAADALSYVGDLIGHASSRYLAEIDTRIEIVFLRLWTTADDPWTETGSNCSLYELGKYWNTQMTGVSRSLVHMLSARPTGGGVAWLRGLCAAPFSAPVAGCINVGSGTVQVGGDYGFTGNIQANFDPDHPLSVWDSITPSHEIGHNFNSPHTHCYNGIGGNAEPIDQCYNGETACYSGAASLPGPANQGSGTIMSYCHLRGGFANVAMTFGTGHPYGTAPERVPARMNEFVDSVAQTNPACIVDDTLFADGFDNP